MHNLAKTLLYIDSDEIELESLVSILELAANKLEINTISEMARIEGKTPRGIKTSNQYRKIYIGKQQFAIKGLTHNELSF